jgi:hypothetical protein
MSPRRWNEPCKSSIPEHIDGGVGYKRDMADPRRFELDELSIRPGTYFNPQTEVVLIVDDSPDVDHEIFDDVEPGEGADWVLISDEAPVDEHRRDELIESFQATYHPAGELVVAGEVDDEDDVENEELEPDEDPEID